MEKRIGGRKVRLTVFLIFCFALLVLCLNSAIWFRLKLADFQLRSGNYDAVFLYAKALRKAKVIKASDVVILSIENRLTKAYLKTCEYYFKKAETYLNRDKTSEDENFFRAMESYQKTIDLYENLLRVYDAIGIFPDNRLGRCAQRAKEEKISACMRLGEQYVNRRDWKAAKRFYTKQILKFLNPIVALETYNSRYNVPAKYDIVAKIWGGDIFVVLEDFEDISRPVMYDWAKFASPRVKAHRISKESFYKGNSSEYFALQYDKPGWDYWAREVDVPLSDVDIPLGVRVFIKSQKPFKGSLRLGIRHGKERGIGIWQIDTWEDVEGGWQMRWIEALVEKARDIERECFEPAGIISIDKILINTAGDSNAFYVDNIELYIADQM